MSSTTESSPRRTASPTGPDVEDPVAPAPQVPLARLYALRAGYLLIAVGLAITKWPLLFSQETWAGMAGVVTAMLLALQLLAVVGVRHPVRMLPVLLFESAWKLIWLAVVALPLWTSGRMDAATWETAFACLFVVLVLSVIPWRYAWDRYVTTPGDRWR